MRMIPKSANWISDKIMRSEDEPRMTQTFKFTVNGKPVSVALDNEETPLLNVLRNELGLMGTRFGCGLEQCGCCTVLIDGVPEKCCAKPVWSVAGKADRHHRGAGHAGAPAPAATGLHRRAGRPVRLLSVRHHRFGQGAARQEPGADARADRRRARRQYLPLRLA